MLLVHHSLPFSLPPCTHLLADTLLSCSSPVKPAELLGEEEVGESEEEAMSMSEEEEEPMELEMAPRKLPRMKR